MGYAITWVCFHGKSLPEAAALLSLRLTGEVDEVFDFEINGVTVPAGDAVIIFNDVMIDLLSPESLSRLSEERALVAVCVEEHVMMSTAAFWRDGEQVWSVDHFGQEGRWHLGVSGALPDFFDEVQAMRMAQQSAQGAEDIDDIFEIPLDMAEKCCGFRHDIGTFDFRELVEA